MAEQAAQGVIGSPLQNLGRTLAFMVVVFVFSTAGFVAAGWTLGDAAYMVILTIFSVGYEEVQPINTTFLRALDMATIVLGCTGMIVLTGALVQTFAHYQLRSLLGMDRMKTQIEKLSGHAIVCGFGRIGQQLAKELAEAGQDFVILERDAGKRASAEAHGYLCQAGDATDEEALKTSGIDRARFLATVLPDDAANVFITLSARNLNPALHIIARGEMPTTKGKLIHAGANEVVMPTHIGAERIAEMILFPETAKSLGEGTKLREIKRSLNDLGLELEAKQVEHGSKMVGQTVAEAEIASKGAFFIVEIDRPGGKVMDQPPRDYTIAAGDTLVMVLRGDRVASAALLAQAAEATA